MGKNKLIFLLIVLMTFAFGVWKFTVNARSKITHEEESKVLTLVNLYYDRLESKDYKGALEFVQLPKSNRSSTVESSSPYESYEIDKLQGNDGQWFIKANGKYGHVFYSKEEKSFGCEVVIHATYGDSSIPTNEIVYLKRIGNDFKIVKIVTRDRYGCLRGPYVISI
jgi:hypothetical protein